MGAIPSNKTDLDVYRTLDGWRGLASLAVVLYHAGLVIVHRQYNGHSPSTIYDVIAFGHLGVPVFFVISGYCIASAAMNCLSGNRALSDFAYARARRIFPAYWASLALILAVAALASALVARGILRDSASAGGGASRRGAFEWVSNLLLIQPIFGYPLISAVSWTLCYEIAFYAVVAIGIWLARRTERTNVLYWLSHVLTIVCLGLLAADLPIGYPWDLWPQFGFGVLSLDVLTKGLGRRTVPWVAAILSTFCVLLILRSGGVGLLGAPLRETYLAAAGCALLLVLLHRFDTKIAGSAVGAALGILGLWSYSLYLTHFAILGLVNQGVRFMPAMFRIHYMQLLISVVACILFAAVFWFYAERPFMRRKRSDAQRFEPSLVVQPASIPSTP